MSQATISQVVHTHSFSFILKVFIPLFIAKIVVSFHFTFTKTRKLNQQETSKDYKKGKERQRILPQIIYDTPPDHLISIIDSWAENLLAGSGLKDDCDICTRRKLHATRAKISREEYRRDVNRNNKSESVIYFACDMLSCCHVSQE